MAEIRLIDANALKEDLKKWFPKFTLDGIEAKTLFNQILHDIDNAPTVESNISETYRVAYEQGFRHGKEKYERPHGEWVMDNEHTKNPLLWYKCNLCGVYHSPTNFCPNCGADMRGGAE